MGKMGFDIFAERQRYKFENPAVRGLNVACDIRVHRLALVGGRTHN